MSKVNKLIILLFLLLYFNLAYAQNIPQPAYLWQGLIAEDIRQGYTVMYADACCVRNRLNAGMNTGLVALKRKNLDEFVRREGKNAELMARDIVRKVFYNNAPDITFGATHYEETRYVKPRWAYKMQITCKIGKNIYYR